MWTGGRGRRSSELEVIRGYCRAVSSTSVNLPSPPFTRGETPSRRGGAGSREGGREGRGIVVAVNSAIFLIFFFFPCLSLLPSRRAPWSVSTRSGAEAVAGLTGLSTLSRCLRSYPPTVWGDSGLPQKRRWGGEGGERETIEVGGKETGDSFGYLWWHSCMIRSNSTEGGRKKQFGRKECELGQRGEVSHKPWLQVSTFFCLYGVMMTYHYDDEDDHHNHTQMHTFMGTDTHTHTHTHTHVCFM